MPDAPLDKISESSLITSTTAEMCMSQGHIQGQIGTTCALFEKFNFICGFIHPGIYFQMVCLHRMEERNCVRIVLVQLSQDRGMVVGFGLRESLFTCTLLLID